MSTSGDPLMSASSVHQTAAKNMSMVKAFFEFCLPEHSDRASMDCQSNCSARLQRFPSAIARTDSRRSAIEPGTSGRISSGRMCHTRCLKVTPLNNGAFKMTETIGTLWCRPMHDAPTWPIHGHYRCGTCRRRYLVPWAETSVSAQISTRGAVGLSQPAASGGIGL